MVCRNVNTGNTCRRYINMNMRRCFPLLTVWSAVCLTVILPEVITRLLVLYVENELEDHQVLK